MDKKIKHVIGIGCIIGIVILAVSIANTMGNDAVYYYNLGLNEYDKGNYTNAIEYFTKAIEIDPKFVDAYYNRGTCYTTEDVFFHHYDKLPSQTYIEAGLEDEEKAYQNAIRDFKKVLELDPNYALAYFGIGNANYLYYDSYTDRKEKVLPYYFKALNHKDWIKKKAGDEGVAAVYTNIGRTYLAMAEMDEAYKNYKKALELAPIDTALEHQAWVCVELGKYDEAYKIATKYIKMAEGSEEADLALMPGMMAAYNLKKYDEAIKYGKEIVKKFPDSGYVAEAHRFLAKIYKEKGNDAQARKETETAVKICTDVINSKDTGVSDLPGAYYERGLAYFDLGEYEKAINDFKYLIDHPEMSNREVAHENYYFEAHLALACAYSQVGKNKEAKQVLEDTLKLLNKPNFQGYRKYRKNDVEALLNEISTGKSVPIPEMYEILGK